jgi:hypothetical protein
MHAPRGRPHVPHAPASVSVRAPLPTSGKKRLPRCRATRRRLRRANGVRSRARAGPLEPARVPALATRDDQRGGPDRALPMLERYRRTREPHESGTSSRRPSHRRRAASRREQPAQPAPSTNGQAHGPRGPPSPSEPRRATISDVGAELPSSRRAFQFEITQRRWTPSGAPPRAHPGPRAIECTWSRSRGSALEAPAASGEGGAVRARAKAVAASNQLTSSRSRRTTIGRRRGALSQALDAPRLAKIPREARAAAGRPMVAERRAAASAHSSSLAPRTVNPRPVARPRTALTRERPLPANRSPPANGPYPRTANPQPTREPHSTREPQPPANGGRRQPTAAHVGHDRTVRGSSLTRHSSRQLAHQAQFAAAHQAQFAAAHQAQFAAAHQAQFAAAHQAQFAPAR